LDAALDPLNAGGLRAWTPIRAGTTGEEPVVDWALLDSPLHEPFFEQSADRAMRHPFNLAFRRRTPISELERLHDGDAGLAPTGFVFHMSRCGSTLVSQMLSRLDAAIVLSEPQPLDALLWPSRWPGTAETILMRRLRAVVSALGYPRGAERRLFVKFHASHVLELPLIAKAFPDVPWAFIFRDPRAVLRSQARMPGPELFQGAIDPSYLGLTADAAHTMSPAEYGAHALAAFCESALANARCGRSLFLEHSRLPEAVVTDLLPFFGVEPTARDVAALRTIALADTKATVARTPRPAPPANDEAAGRLASNRLDRAYAELRARAAAAR
jgi:hypothetical protein